MVSYGRKTLKTQIPVFLNLFILDLPGFVRGGQYKAGKHIARKLTKRQEVVSK